MSSAPLTTFSKSMQKSGLGYAAFLICATLFLAPVAIQAQNAERQFQPSEKLGEELPKLQPFIDAQNWDGAAKLISTLLASAAPNSYDQAFLSDMLGRLYLQKGEGEYVKALAPMETALRLSDTYGYFDAKGVTLLLDYLSKLYYSESGSTKSPALQQQYLSKATVYLKRLMDMTPNPTADNVLFYTSLLYNRAVFNPDKIDMDLLGQAKQEAEKALLLSTRPKENFYLILLSTLQQQGDYKRAAEYYELLVKQYPSNKNYWTQLMAIYVTLAGDGDEKQALAYNLRTIVTIERAQALGFLNTPKDNYNLVGIYFNIGQFAKATELLYSGLKKGGIESTLKNWELLAYSYQQINRENQAIEVLQEAAKQFPQSGQIEFQIGQIYYSLDKVADAYRHYKLAVGKGNLDKPGAAYSFLAYVCFELGKLEEALEVINLAMEIPGSENDAQLPRLRQAIEDALREREAAKAGATTL